MCYTPDALIVNEGIQSKPWKPAGQVTGIGLAASSIYSNWLKKRDRLRSVVLLSKISMKLKILSQSVNRR